MPARSKTDIVRGCFAAYKTKDRTALEALFADGFRFTSPYDDAIDKAAYFERCWPSSVELIRENIIERIFEQDGGAFVTYKCRTVGDDEFRNTEFFTFDGDQVRSIEVYFGASYRHGAFVRKTEEESC